jgi:predicted nucleic acid-binding protein
VKSIVVDASVVLKWFLADEDRGKSALELFEKLLAGELRLVAPTLLEFEIANGLAMAARRGRLGRDTARAAIQGFLDLEIDMVDFSHYYGRMFEIADTYDLSAYDAAYVAVAAETGFEMITADRELWKKVKRDLKWVRLLGEKE